MLNKSMVILMSWVLLVAAVSYLAMLVSLVARLKRDQPEYWVQICSPRLSDPNGQIAIFWKVICGADFPQRLASRYRRELRVVRISLIVGVMIFLIMMAAAFSHTIQSN
jgi:hypothetical protein